MIAKGKIIGGKIVEGYYISPNKNQTFIKELCINSTLHQVDNNTVRYKIGDTWVSYKALQKREEFITKIYQASSEYNKDDFGNKQFRKKIENILEGTENE